MRIIVQIFRQEVFVDIEFQVIPHGTSFYQAAVKLRQDVLREPLGLTFTSEDMEAEKAHIQIIGVEGEKVRACAVLVPEGTQMKMQRVAVAPDLQGHGIGRAMTKFCERYAVAHGAKSIYVHARHSAVSFYEKCWYVGEGEMFDEDGIPHLKMWKLLSPP